MFQIVYTYQKRWPEGKSAQIEGEFRQEVAVSPEAARRRANGYLAGHITMMVKAGQPALVLNDAPVWRVPACLVTPGQDETGMLGTVDVDAQTGEIIPFKPEKIIQMQALAHAIAAYFSLSTT